MTYEASKLPDRNGDQNWSIRAEGRGVGTVRLNPRTGDYHAVYQSVRGPKSRYFSSMRGAANWLAKNAK